MKILSVLENLDALLESWNIKNSDWILVSQYAYRLLGYKVKIRKGHFNILVREKTIPWKIKEGIEIHPPHGSKFRKDFENFINKTGFDFDLNLSSDNEFKEKEGKYVLYKLSNKRLIRVQTPAGAIREFEKLLAYSTDKGLGIERLDKDIFYIKDMIRALSLKKETATKTSFLNLLERFEDAKHKRHLLLQKEKGVIHGIAASTGKVRGAVRIIKAGQKVKNVTDGTILVTEMTSPAMTTLMSSVAGIVTDKGGSLSHGAILAREMRIPCIVGTQTATKYFKNGDLVELDANMGVVKKLK